MSGVAMSTVCSICFGSVPVSLSSGFGGEPVYDATAAVAAHIAEAHPDAISDPIPSDPNPGA